MIGATAALAADAAREALAALRGGDPVIAAVVIESAGDPGLVGARLLVRRDGREGTLGDPVLDERVVELGRATLGSAGGPAVHQVGLESGGECTVYLEPFRPAPELLIYGAGHIARPLCEIGALLGFRVAVLDDRPALTVQERFPRAARVGPVDYDDPLREVELRPDSCVVLVTRAHRFDVHVLAHLLRRPDPPAYAGMVGSRRRVRAVFEQLAAEGIPLERLRAIHAPIGLDIGAESPEEIAVAVGAELVRTRRGGSGAPLREKERVVDRWLAEPGTFAS